MLCTIFDAVSGDKIARTRVMQAEESKMVLSNLHGEVRALLNTSQAFKIKLDDESYMGPVKAVSMSKGYITVKILPNNKMFDKRQYLRIPCNLKVNAYSCGSVFECCISEIAYGGCIINCKDELGENAGITLQLHNGELVVPISGKVIRDKTDATQNDEFWYAGCEYAVQFDTSCNLKESMDELYTIILNQLIEYRRAISESRK